MQRLYVIALYAEQLEPDDKRYFPMAESETRRAIAQIEERYGWEWVQALRNGSAERAGDSRSKVS